MKKELESINNYIDEVVLKKAPVEWDPNNLFSDLEKIFEERDLTEFRAVLTRREDYEYENELVKLREKELEISRKYNKIASDRISHKVLVNNIKANIDIFTEESLESFDLKCLQNLLNILLGSSKKKQG